MKRIVLTFAILFAASVGWCADAVTVLDSVGNPLGKLPVVPRGDETLVPVGFLARIAAWPADQMEGHCVFTVPGGSVALRRGNPFARSNRNFVQLRALPEEWDGSLWVPLRSLPDLFPGLLSLDTRYNLIRVYSIKPAPSPRDSTGVLPSGGESRWRLRRVIIDPGHGGKDPGAKGLNGLVEKEVALDIARRLQILLESRSIAADLTRSHDEFLSLHDRTRFANERQGDLFVSIHCNSARDSSIRGTESYFLKPARTRQAVDAAMRENSVVKLEDNTGTYQDLTEENYILLTMATSQYLKDSELWAVQTLRELRSGGGLEARGVDQAGFYVLMGASMPAVLVECGYLSSPDDAWVLASDRGRQKIADALLASILKLKQSMEASASR
jgi:N-acetylmuramoyl-L-alanine amidase